MRAVVFDIETASYYSSLDELREQDPRLHKLWLKRDEYLRARFPENAEKTPNELYLEKAPLAAEFCRIVCATFARYEIKDGVDNITYKSYASYDEMEVLKGIHTVFDKFKGFTFVGHNIKRFDIPVICKRLLINGFDLPNPLRISSLKPWELPYFDTSDRWSFGAWQESFCSLDLLTSVLGIESPKQNMEGSEVNEHYWNNNLEEIEKYCTLDVGSTLEVYLKLINT